MIQYLRQWLSPSIEQSASTLGKRGAQVRYANEREQVRATARQICAEIGKPVPPILETAQ